MNPEPTLSLIAAVADNGVIGRNGELPWRLSADLQRFKSLTMGHAIVMGRKTRESINRALPGRVMIIVSRQPYYTAPGCHVALGLDAALALASSLPNIARDEIFVIGGGELYRAALPRAAKIYLTRVHASPAGDAWFPDVDWNQWNLAGAERHAADAKNEYDYSFEDYERRQSFAV